MPKLPDPSNNPRWRRLRWSVSGDIADHVANSWEYLTGAPWETRRRLHELFDRAYHGAFDLTQAIREAFMETEATQ